MGRICEANRGLGRGFIDDGGSATVRKGDGGKMVAFKGSSVGWTSVAVDDVICGVGSSSGMDISWLIGVLAVRLDTCTGGIIRRDGPDGKAVREGWLQGKVEAVSKD